MKKLTLMLCLMLGICNAVLGENNKLDNILKRGYINIGTTGDYKPFTYLNGSEYQGYDIEVAKEIGKHLGVEVKFVKTTWKELLSGLEENQYDIAVGGITRTIARKIKSEISDPYLIFGKCYLVRPGDEKKYDTIEAVNKKEVRVGVNRGGTNEIFAQENLKDATIVIYENNLDVPEAVAKGEVDVMITESPEAYLYEKKDPRLKASRADTPFTKSQMGYLIPKGEQELLNTVNFILEELELTGKIDSLKKEYLN